MLNLILILVTAIFMMGCKSTEGSKTLASPHQAQIEMLAGERLEQAKVEFNAKGQAMFDYIDSMPERKIKEKEVILNLIAWDGVTTARKQNNKKLLWWSPPKSQKKGLLGYSEANAAVAGVTAWGAWTAFSTFIMFNELFTLGVISSVPLAATATVGLWAAAPGIAAVGVVVAGAPIIIYSSWYLGGSGFRMFSHSRLNKADDEFRAYFNAFDRKSRSEKAAVKVALVEMFKASKISVDWVPKSYPSYGFLARHGVIEELKRAQTK